MTKNAPSRLTLKRGRLYGWTMYPGYGNVPYRSPIQVHAVKSLGNCELELSFLNMFYAVGVQNMSYRLRTLRRAQHYFFAEQVEDDQTTERSVVIEELSPHWLRVACPDIASQVDDVFAEDGQPIEEALLRLLYDRGSKPTTTEHGPFLNRSGRTCLDRVEERDIDLLLLEEFISEPELPSVFGRRLFHDQAKLKFLEISNSVSTASGGESDLIALYKYGDETHAVLIENKISAPFMSSQAFRYHKRGRAGIEDGSWDKYVTCLLAPQVYLDGDHGEHVFDYKLPYEELLPHFEGRCRTIRSQWRAAILHQAIKGAKSSHYVRVADLAVSQFFRSYRAYASHNFPALRMPVERDRPATNTWVQFRPEVDLPSRISLLHKARYGTVDIQVSACRVEDLYHAIGNVLASEMQLEQTGKSACVRIMVPKIDASRDFEIERDKVHQALEAADTLRSVLLRHRKTFACL